MVGGGGGSTDNASLDPAVNNRCSEIVISLYDFMPTLADYLKVDKKTINTQDAKVRNNLKSEFL